MGEIAIIGGADGPTVLFLSGGSTGMLIGIASLFLLLFGLVIAGLVRNIKRNKPVKICIYGILTAFFVLLLVIVVAACVYLFCRQQGVHEL